MTDHSLYKLIKSTRWNALHSVLLCLAVLLQTQPGLGQVSTAPVHDWRASWITSLDAPAKATAFLHFRKSFVLDVVPASFPVYVSADDQFQLRVNGKLVGFGPSVGDTLHWPYEVYDIAPFLHEGSNVIAATVWHFGEDAPVRQMSERLGFVLDCDPGSAADISTDKSWEVELEPGITTLDIPPAVKAQYYVSSLGERFDGAAFDWNWDAAPASGGNWKNAAVIGRAIARGKNDTSTVWQMVADGLPHMERSHRATGSVVRIVGLGNAGAFPEGDLTVPAHTQATVLLDAGQVITAFPELTLSGGRGATVSATYTEALYGPGDLKGNRNEVGDKTAQGLMDQIVPDGGDRRQYTPLDWRTWRYLQLTIDTADQPIVLNGLKTWFTAYPLTNDASFHSDDPVLSKIWQTGWDTLRICAHDTYMDTPYWERLQYVGDSRIEALVTYATTTDDRLPREAIQAFHNSLLSDGITLSRYPSRKFQSIPGFSLYYVGMVHDFWMYRNDPGFVRSQISAVRSTLDFFRARQNKDDLLGVLPWWPFVDWANGFERGVPPQTAEGDSSILSLQFVEALRYAADMEDSLGDPALAREDRQDADRIAKAVYTLCWSDKEHLLADTPEKTHFSQHANIYGVWLDVIPRGMQRSVMERILSSSDAAFAPDTAPAALSNASFYYRFYLARALLHAGLGDRYIDTLEPWRVMLAHGLTTWAETPEPTRSDSHAWSAHPTYDLLSSVAGVMPGSPGFSSVHIEPHLGKLRQVTAAVPTPRGIVQVDLHVDANGVTAIVELPSDLAGTFVWNGKEFVLQPGKTQLQLSPAAN
jgi:hypothetical protein